MTKLISLELDYGIKVSSRVHDYLSPDNVYFPISKTSKIKIKDKEKILKGQLILINGEEKIFSSVSGIITGIKRVIINNQEKTFLVIANDYKEKSIKKSIRKKFDIKDKNELENILKDYGINISMDIKDTLLLNAIDPEPYLVNNTMYLLKNINSVLESLDNLKTILNFKKVIILLKNIETEILTKLNNILGTYPDFRVITVPNYYMIERKENYNAYIDEAIENIFELSLTNYYKINEVLEKNKPVTEKYITITGDAIKNPIVINAKIGTKVSKIIEELIKIKKDEINISYYYNGLMKGYKTEINDLIIDNDFEGLVITKNTLAKEEKCIKCGLCLKYCPLGISPIDNINKEIKCLNCGLCTCLCPSNINFKNITKKDDKYE